MTLFNLHTLTSPGKNHNCRVYSQEAFDKMLEDANHRLKQGRIYLTDGSSKSLEFVDMESIIGTVTEIKNDYISGFISEGKENRYYELLSMGAIPAMRYFGFGKKCNESGITEIEKMTIVSYDFCIDRGKINGNKKEDSK